MRNGIWRANVALFAGGVTLGCGETAAPEPADWDEWPWMETSIASPSVAVTGASVVFEPASNTLRVSARFINTGTDSALVQHGACAFGIRLREVNGRALMPIAWDNRPDGAACILPLYYFYVPANGTRDVTVADLRPSALRGVVKAGEYHVNVAWRRGANDRVLEASAGTIIVHNR